MMRYRDEPLYLPRTLSYLIAVFAIAFGFGGVRVFARIWDTPSWSSGVLVGALVGFLTHEYIHELAARALGCYARFTLSKLGLGLTLFFGVLRSLGVPFVVLAPGYVSVRCLAWAPTIRGEFKISAAGPAANIVLATAAKLASWLLDGRFALFAHAFADINAWLALFNLLPFYPLDGSKVFRENVGVWVLMFAAAVILAYIL